MKTGSTLHNKIISMCLLLFAIAFINCSARPSTRSELIEATKNVRLPAKATEDYALVYIMRPGNMYNNYSYEVYVNDPTNTKNYAGSNKGRQYFYFFLSPGNHRIYSISDNGSWLDIQAKEKINYFIEQNTSKGLVRGINTLRYIDIYHGKWNIKTLSPGYRKKKFHYLK